jgi:GNAT superfamily N-acetyltransferase
MTKPVGLILSGAYIDQELAAELGVLPPAFLPVGMGRLYDLQIESLAALDGNLFMTLPSGMALSEWDTARLAQAGVSVLPSPEGLGLGSALLNALAVIGFDDTPIRILHGDTLIQDVDLEAEDAISVAPGGDGYRWATVRETDGVVDEIAPPDPTASSPPPLRLSGYFAFSSTRGLAQALARARGDFLIALNLYGAEHRLRTLPGGRWLDFGHVQTFFRSRRVVSTARAFNQLQISDTAVRKGGDQPEKLKAEAYWLSHAPPAIRPYCARLIEAGEDAKGYFYSTDYEYIPTLAELYAFGRVNRSSWSDILSSCGAFMDAAAGVAPEAEAGADPNAPCALHALAIDKTHARLEQFARQTGFDLDAPLRLNGRPCPSVRRCAEAATAIVAAATPHPAVMHGDFCFSNILYSFRTRRIRLIDPRGYTTPGRPSLYGDSLYDAAKLMHSAAGRYDLIIADRYAGSSSLAYDLTLRFADDAEQLWLERAAAERTMGGVKLGSTDVMAVTTTLFLSMLPLHADKPKRQWALLANGLRLFLDLQQTGAA